jgi:glycosyltransferase involved in cell wall biosynthesis
MTSVDSTSITPETIGDPAVVEVSLLVPVKDEVASLAQLVDEVTAAMDGETDGAGHGWELIFIDDGSTSAIASGSRPSSNLVYRNHISCQRGAATSGRRVQRCM